MHAHRLQAHAADALALVGRLLVHDVILGAVEFVAEPLGHAADGVGELVDDGVEERHRGREALAALDGAAGASRPNAPACCRAVISMRSVITKRSRTRSSLGLREVLVQVGHHADDLVAEDVEPHVLVGAGEHLARAARRSARAARSRRGSARRRARDGSRSSPAVVGERAHRPARWE